MTNTVGWVSKVFPRSQGYPKRFRCTTSPQHRSEEIIHPDYSSVLRNSMRHQQRTASRHEIDQKHRNSRSAHGHGFLAMVFSKWENRKATKLCTIQEPQEHQNSLMMGRRAKRTEKRLRRKRQLEIRRKARIQQNGGCSAPKNS
eukprot:GHVN01089536.1.p1 GENE.GHVN01089536.1~~GHVN01089536.1.p1  ORF type:complete len:144 (+),score=12.02 GHVN01089536.1:50-481(+)